MAAIGTYPNEYELESIPKYGLCRHCDTPLSPVWFTEEETIVIQGVLCKTGRKRLACSHLTCMYCLRNEVVDDSFDGKWS